MDKAFQSEEFVLGPNINGPRTVKMFTASPTQFERDHLGQLFVLAEIESENKHNESIIQFLHEEIKRNYYATEHEDIGQNVEEALTKTNRACTQLLEEHGSEFLEHLNILIVVQYGEELHLAHVGTIHAFLIHNKKIVDILSSAGSSRYEPVNPLKIFSNVVSGQVSAGDKVVLCNTTVLDYLSLEKIRKTFVDAALPESITQVKTLLGDANPETLFGVLAWDILSTTVKRKELPPLQQEETKKEPAPTSPPEPIALIDEQKDAEQPKQSDEPGGKRYSPEEPAPTSPPEPDSLSSLQSQQQSTTELLEPSMRNKMRSAIDNMSKTVQRYRTNGEKTNEDDVPDSLPNRLRQRQDQQSKPRGILARIVRLLVFWATGFVELVIRGLKAIVSYRPKRMQKGAWRGARHSRTTTWIMRLRDAPLRTKLLLGASVLFLFVFALIITRDSAPDDSGFTESDYESMYASAQEKIQEADAVLIYGNETDALGFLTEAVDLLDDIPNDRGSLSEDVETLLKTTTDTINRINGVIVLNDPTVVVDLRSQFPNIATSGMTLFQGALWVSHPGDPALYQVNPTSGSATDRQTDAGHGVAVAAASGSSLLLIGSEGDSTLYDPASDSAESLSITHLQSNPSIAAAQVFNNRLYTLDQDTGQIYVHEATGSGYAEGVEWFTDGTVLRSPTSMIIDGSIYTAESAGVILPLYTGAKLADGASYSIEPELKTGTRLVSTEISDNLYVLDPENKRVIIFTKETGEIVAQFTSDAFTDTKAISVDESRNKIFVLNDTAIYEIDIPQE